MYDKRPLTVELTYEDGKVEQYSFPQTVEQKDGIVNGKWISLPHDLTDKECEWVFYELGSSMRHLGGQ